MPVPHVVILGLMGVGKSTIGRGVAEELGRHYADSDADIEALTGVTGRDFADRYGIPALHELEAAVLLGALVHTEPLVIGAAASTVENELVQQVLRGRALVVRLTASLETTIERQSAGGHRRPMDLAELRDLAHRREPLFAGLEDLRVDTGGRPEESVGAVLEFLQGSPRTPPNWNN